MPDSETSVQIAYTDCRKHFLDYLRRNGRRSGLAAGESAPAAVRAWQRRARGTFVHLLGLERMKAAPLRARRIESVACDGYTRQLWQLTTQRDVTMPFYLLRPAGVAGPLPAVICAHGHGVSFGKCAPAGVGMHERISQAIEHYNYAYGVAFARAGLLAICPDARGFGQRQEPEVREDVGRSSCHALQLIGSSLGMPVAGMWVFDLMRLVDYLRTRRDVAADRIGCAGLSGGGLQTLYLAAVDDRVSAAVVSGYFYGVGQSLLNRPMNCACNLVPHLWEHFDMGDLAALIAPRPLLIETGDADELNGDPGLANVRPQVAIARRAYRALDAGEQIVHDIFPGGHRWSGRKALPFMKRWLTQ